MTSPQTELQKFLAILVPEGDLTIIDVYGHSVRLSSKISARKQIVAGRILSEMIALPSFIRLYNEVIALEANKDATVISGAVLSMIARYMTDKSIIDKLCELFTSVYPEACQRNGESVDPLDLYGMEDLVKAIIPFVVRPVMGLTEVVESLK